MIARLDVVARHATRALYNAVEHRRIPMRFLWMPLAKVQEGLGGKARAISAGRRGRPDAARLGADLRALSAQDGGQGRAAAGGARQRLRPMMPGRVEHFTVEPGEIVGAGPRTGHVAWTCKPAPNWPR